MTVSSFLYSLASVPMFASRPFLAALVTALLARFGASIPWLSQSDMVQALDRAPEWFTSWPVLGGLLVLAVGEALATKHAEVREVMQEIDGILKSVVAMLVALALLDRETTDTLRSIQKAGLGLHSLGALVIGGLVYVVAALRRGAIGILSEIDDDDDIGLQSILNWVESSWTVLGLLFLVIFPVVALVLSALTVLGLWVARKRAERREQRSRIPCATCAAPIFPHATACHACRTTVAAPRRVGVFGQPRPEPETDLERQRFELVSRKRCPLCATRLKARAVEQECPTCGTVTFASRAEFERYLAVIQARLPRTLLVCLGLSAVPLLGVVPGVIYYRLTVVSGLRGYIPPLRGCLTRWLVRVINWGIIALQPIPVLGALILPIMCLSTYSIYRRALSGRARSDLARVETAPRAA